MTGLRVAIERRVGNFKLAMEFTANREILVLFGPSGAGKSQTLNSIAGLNHPDSGSIELDGETFFRHDTPGQRIDVSARRRRVAYVFQQYALFPHLTAIENVAFSFHRERDARTRAMKWLSRMRIENLADRYAHEVSGGQQQRIAIARALASEPRVLLLDEPFSALDYPLRQQLHEELLRLQEQAPLIVIYVTHNLEEALAMGQRLAIVRNGRVEQIGTLDQVVRNPQSLAVAEILGLPNLFKARVVNATERGTELDWNGVRLVSDTTLGKKADWVTGYLAAELFDLGPSTVERPALRNHLPAVVRRRHTTLRSVVLKAELENNAEIEVALSLRDDPGEPQPGERVLLNLAPHGVRVFPM
jgi:molybdate transport system ATP-binding protein